MKEEILKKLEIYCNNNSHIKMTEQRKIIAQVIATSTDHPNVEKVFERAKKLDNKISIATTYRTIKLLEDADIIEKHDFGGGKSRYELVTNDHHDHIINVNTGEIVEFFNQELEDLKKSIVQKMGYELIDHRLELFVIKKKQP